MSGCPRGSGRPHPKGLLVAPSLRAARRKSLPNFLKTRLYSFLAHIYLRWVGATSRVVWVNRSIREDLEKEGRGFIYAFWHGRQVFLVYLHQNDRIHPLVSQSNDGELIARVCRAFGIEPVRGSSSKGGAEAVLELKSVVESGDRVGFTPDGPRGPFHSIQPGVLYLAQKTGRPIVPVSYSAARSWVIKAGWDHFMVPKPFNRISMVYGEAIHVKSDDDLEKKAAELKAALDRVTNDADSVAGASCC